MTLALIQQLLLAIGGGLLLYVLATWRLRSSRSRAAGCALSSLLCGGSAVIGALS